MSRTVTTLAIDQRAFDVLRTVPQLAQLTRVVLVIERQGTVTHRYRFPYRVLRRGRGLATRVGAGTRHR